MILCRKKKLSQLTFPTIVELWGFGSTYHFSVLSDVEKCWPMLHDERTTTGVDHRLNDLVEVWLDSTLLLLRLLLQQDPGRLQPACLPVEILCTKACCIHKSFTPCKSLDNIEIRRDMQWHMTVWNDLPCCSHLLSCSSWPRAKSEEGKIHMKS